MSIPNPKVFKELLANLYKARTDETIQAQIASLRSVFENLPDVDVAFVEERVKSPVSALKKYSDKDKPEYREKWNNMKDLIGLMVIVENNDEIDKVIDFISKNYADLKNPNSEVLVQDFRKKSVRKEDASEENFTYQDPTGRPYQTTDGYKNVRANLMLGEFPVEIQVKTKEQYIAHFATHDPTYKSVLLKDEDEKKFISDKLFPYFEASAHIRLHKDEMTHEEISAVRKDISQIMERNHQYFQDHPKVFNDARIIFGVYTYILLHRDEIMRDAVLESGNTNLQTTITELERVFKYTQREILHSNDSLTHNTSIPATLDKLMEMPYEQFKQTKDKIRGTYRMESCSVTGVFDGISADFVKMIKHLTENYLEVHVGVLNDQLAEAYLGRPTLYNEQIRQAQVENCKGVTSVYSVDDASSKAQIKISYEIEGTEPEPKPFDKVIAGGLFDGLHPGHQEHLKIIANSGEEVIILVKSNDYSERMKNKTPVFSEETRKTLVEAQKGVTKTFITDNDVKPPQEVLEIMDEAIANGEKVAIFVGSDWTKHPDQKPQCSLDEMEFLKTHYPEVTITGTDRPEKSYSSTQLRNALIEAREGGDNNPYEITNLGESLV